MSDFCNTKDVKMRKDHKCGFCNRVIPKGMKVKFASGMFEGEFFNSYLDDFCKEILNILHDDYSEGYNEDCFGELDFWFFECDLCGDRIDISDNDIKNKKIILECESCGNVMKMDYEKVLEKVRENK